LLRAGPRNAVTVAALACAVAMVTGVGTMIHAFRGSVTDWVDATLQAGLYLTPAANEIVAGSAFLPEELPAALRALPGVEKLDSYREWETQVSGTTISVALVEADTRQKFELLQSVDRAMTRFASGEGVLISESLARVNQWKPGRELEIDLGGTYAKLPVLGVCRDYTRDRGVLFFPANLFRERTGDQRMHSAALHVKPGVEIEAVRAQIRALLPEPDDYLLYTQNTLRERVQAIFDQVFAVTHLLRVISIAVAVAGIATSLGALVLERRRDLAALRAVGMSRGQLATVTIVEGLFLGACAALIGVLAGLLLAVVLTFVINVAFFGWSVGFRVPWAEVLSTPLWVLPVAALAAWWPALQACRTPISAAVRSE